MNTSQMIRDFAHNNPVFGADEIRELHGQKAALLVTRLAAKGQFVRIMNGVFGTTNFDQTSSEYQDYLERMHQALLIRAARPDASVADRLFAWASERTTFRIPEADRHFGQPMKGHIASYTKRGKFTRPTEGVYAYVGYVPAARRESLPMAEIDSNDHHMVIAALESTALGAAALSIRTGIASPRMRTVLARLAHDGRILTADPSSINAHHVYSLADAPPSVPADPQNLSILAIIASSGAISTRGVRTHHVEDTARRMQQMLAAGLIKQDGVDETLGGLTYSVTNQGMTILADNGYATEGADPIVHRLLERRILALLRQGEAGYDQIHTIISDVTRDQIEMACLRLSNLGVVSKIGRANLLLKITGSGLKCFSA